MEKCFGFGKFFENDVIRVGDEKIITP